MKPRVQDSSSPTWVGGTPSVWEARADSQEPGSEVEFAELEAGTVVWKAGVLHSDAVTTSNACPSTTI